MGFGVGVWGSRFRGLWLSSLHGTNMIMFRSRSSSFWLVWFWHKIQETRLGKIFFFQQRVFTFNFMSPVSVWYWHLSMIWKIERDRVLPRVYNTNTSTLSNTYYCFTVKHLILWRHTNTFLTSSTKGWNITRVTFFRWERTEANDITEPTEWKC